MKIVQYLVQGHDFPPRKDGWDAATIEKFKKEIDKVTRRRLELRESDIVEIHLLVTGGEL